MDKILGQEPENELECSSYTHNLMLTVTPLPFWALGRKKMIGIYQGQCHFPDLLDIKVIGQVAEG